MISRALVVRRAPYFLRFSRARRRVASLFFVAFFVVSRPFRRDIKSNQTFSAGANHANDMLFAVRAFRPEGCAAATPLRTARDCRSFVSARAAVYEAVAATAAAAGGGRAGGGRRPSAARTGRRWPSSPWAFESYA